MLTEAEFLARERISETRHEYVNGEAFAMAGGSPRHAILALQLARAIGNRLTGDCVAAGSDLRVHCPATGLYTYPDLTVTCGPFETAPNDRNSVVNPRGIFEVLSSSTEAYDRGAKFEHYRRIESLQVYVLVSQSGPLVHQLRRGDGNVWTIIPTSGLDAVVALPTFGIEVPMAEIYHQFESYPGDGESEPRDAAL